MQKPFENSSTKESSGATISVIDNSQLTTENVGVGMYLSLMGNFNISTPILMIGSSLGSESSSLSSNPFHISHLEDPWTLPSPSTSNEDPRPTKMDMLLSTTKISYKDTLGSILDPRPSSSWKEDEDAYVLLSLETASSHSHDCFDDTFPSNEAILAAMNGLDGSWEELYHRYYFLS